MPQDGDNRPSLRYLTGKKVYYNATKVHGVHQDNGRRVTQGTPRDYYLWVWKNPRDSVEVASIEIQPQERRFIVAGITLGYLDEDPIPRRPRREVKITLPQSDDADKPFDMEVNVDRGVATYLIHCPKTHLMRLSMTISRVGVNPRTTRAVQRMLKCLLHLPQLLKSRTQGETLGAVNWGRGPRKGDRSTQRTG